MPRKRVKADVDGCPTHTRYDQNRNAVRIGPCNGACRLAAELEGSLPLTVFLNKLADYTADELDKADPAKAAKVFGINPDHAAGYIRMAKESRGVRDVPRDKRKHVRNSRGGKTTGARKRSKIAA